MFVSKHSFRLMEQDRDFWRALACQALKIPTPAAPKTPAAPALVPAAPPHDTTPTWDEVGAAVTMRAGQNGALRAHLAEYAQQMRNAGQTNAEIIRRVTDWSYRPSEISPTHARDRAEAEAVVAGLLDREDVT